MSNQGHMAEFRQSQRSIQSRCYHPSGKFIAFGKQDIEQLISARFEQQASKDADRIAVRTQSREMSYSALNGAANRIAHAILSLHLRSEKPVALLVQDTALMIGAVPGALKVGKPFVVLDIAERYESLANVLQDSQASVVLADGRARPVADTLAQGARPVIEFDNREAGLSPENPGLAISSDSGARISHTSGSTGQPKGVVHNHRNILQTDRAEHDSNDS